MHAYEAADAITLGCVVISRDMVFAIAILDGWAENHIAYLSKDSAIYSSPIHISRLPHMLNAAQGVKN